MKRRLEEQEKSRKFYNDTYHASPPDRPHVSCHLRRLAKKLEVAPDQRILDVACGTGNWLMAATALGAEPSGIDLSQNAIDVCKRNLPNGHFVCGSAELLPFPDSHFDIVTCFGALEHFLDQQIALKEIVRVARYGAKIILLVPNSDFLTAKLGLYKGTHQAEIKEESKTIEEWNQLFECSGLKVEAKWRDLHILNWSWIFRGVWYLIPLRILQALVLPFLPLRWQYQIYFLCQK